MSHPAARVLVFPFDCFGNAGTGAGAKLLGDVVREILADTEDETRPTRQDSFRGRLTVEEFEFDTAASLAAWRKTGRKAAKDALATDQFTLWLGGNHLSVLPIYDELTPDDVVIQFDAHLDVYSQHDVTKELSNGNFLKHVSGDGPRVVNVGHRDLFLTPNEVGKTFGADIATSDLAGDREWVREVLCESQPPRLARVWIDVDADVFDPAFCPAVHNPLPFGLAPLDFLPLLNAAWSEQVVGLSISEFDPGRDVRDMSLNLLGWLTEFVLLKACEETE
ncbi:MAG TPA: arginase family protein [Fimbriiglobus sp.]|jgi:arginase family enzyme